MLEGSFPDYSEEVNFKLRIFPQRAAVARETFEKESAAYTVGIDGLVDSVSFKNKRRPIANVDHHRDSPRLIVRSTMGQVWMEVRQGFYDVFRDQYGPRIEVEGNDGDEDDAVSIRLLKKPHLVYRDPRRRVEQMVDLMDKVDSTAGTYRLDLQDPDVKAMFWITDPYRDFRCSGANNRRIESEYLDVIDEIGRRLECYKEGTHKEISADTRYKKLHEEKPVNGQGGWVMIEEIGKQARIGAIADGHKAIVSTRSLDNGRTSVVLARISDNIEHFDLDNTFKERLNELDDVKDWGGADLVMGSPRGVGTKFTPDQLQEIISELVSDSIKSTWSGRNSRMISTPPTPATNANTILRVAG